MQAYRVLLLLLPLLLQAKYESSPFTGRRTSRKEAARLRKEAARVRRIILRERAFACTMCCMQKRLVSCGSSHYKS
jgi:hypothetical protein